MIAASSCRAATIRPGLVNQESLYYRLVRAATTRPLFAAVADAMSHSVSHNKPPGKPTTIMHRPTTSEAASAGSAGIPNPDRTTTKPS